MRLNPSRAGLLLALLAAPSAAAAAEPSSLERAREARTDRQAPGAQRQAPVELVCRSVEIAGGPAEAAPMLCMSAAEWRRAGRD